MSADHDHDHDVVVTILYCKVCDGFRPTDHDCEVRGYE